MARSGRRPRSITILAWLVVLWGFVSGSLKVWLLLDPDTREVAFKFTRSVTREGPIPIPIEWQVFHALVGVPVLLLSGIFLLKGRSWARTLLLVWMTGTVVLTGAVAGWSASLALKLSTVAFLAFLLTRPRATAFFSRQEPDPGREPTLEQRP